MHYNIAEHQTIYRFVISLVIKADRLRYRIRFLLLVSELLRVGWTQQAETFMVDAGHVPARLAKISDISEVIKTRLVYHKCLL